MTAADRRREEAATSRTESTQREHRNRGTNAHQKQLLQFLMRSPCASHAPQVEQRQSTAPSGTAPRRGLRRRRRRMVRWHRRATPASAPRCSCMCICVLTEELGPVGLNNTAGRSDQLGDVLRSDGLLGIMQDECGIADQQLLLLSGGHAQRHRDLSFWGNRGRRSSDRRQQSASRQQQQGKGQRAAEEGRQWTCTQPTNALETIGKTRRKPDLTTQQRFMQHKPHRQDGPEHIA